jgi:hypothetical protein
MEGTALDVTDGPGGEQVTVRLEPRTAEAYTAVVYLAVDNDDDDLLRLPVEGEVRSYEVDPASGTVRFDRDDARNVTGA